MSCTGSLSEGASRCTQRRRRHPPLEYQAEGLHDRPSTLLAPAPYPKVLADARPSSFLAPAPYPKVLADARPSALLAPAPYPKVLADARPSALLAHAPYPKVLADARPSALLALSSSPIVLTLPRLFPSCSLPPPPLLLPSSSSDAARLLLPSPLCSSAALCCHCRHLFHFHALSVQPPPQHLPPLFRSMISLSVAVPFSGSHARCHVFQLHCKHTIAACPRTDSVQIRPA